MKSVYLDSKSYIRMDQIKDFVGCRQKYQDRIVKFENKSLLKRRIEDAEDDRRDVSDDRMKRVRRMITTCWCEG